MVSYYKVFAAPRSCSTVFARLMKLNCGDEVTLSDSEWPHGCAVYGFRHADTSYKRHLFLCVRRPYAWLDSYYRYLLTVFRIRGAAGDMRDSKLDREISFEEFVLSPDGHFRSPIDRWLFMNKHWLEMTSAVPAMSTIIHSHNLLTPKRQTQTIQRCRRSLGLRKSAVVQTESQVVSAGDILLPQTFSPQYYLEKEYLKNYNDRMIDFVNSRLDADRDLLTQFGIATGL